MSFLDFLSEQPRWLRVALATLGAILLAAALTAAWSNDFHRETCVKAINASGVQGVYLANCIADDSALMDAFDPILNDSMQGSVCESFYYGFVDQSIHDEVYDASYYCAVNNKTYDFNKTFYNQVLNAVVHAVGGNATVELNASVPTPTSTTPVASTLAPSTQPVTSGVTGDEALRQYLADLRQQTINAEVELRVKERLAGYSCFYSSARKIEMFKRWKQLSPSAKQCLPSFLALNKTTYSAFAGQCAEFPFSQDKNYAAFLARGVLDEYARNEFAVTTTTKVKILMPDEDATDASEIPFTFQEVLVYKPYEVTAGCLIEFQDKLDSENSLLGAGFNNATILIAIIIALTALAVIAWYSYGRW